MLQLTIKPKASVAFAPVAAPAMGPTLADLRAHVAARIARGELAVSTGNSYLGAIDKIGEWLNTPLDRLAADLDWHAERFPKHGFDPTQHPTHKAYQLFRRRVQAALREFCGVHAATAALRAQEDSWTLLLAVLEPRTKATTDKAELHPMELNALRIFSLVARALGYQPADLDEARAKEIDDAYRGNKRTSNRGALDLLDYVRTFPEALPYLPPEPIGFTAAVRKAAKVPASFEHEFLPWIDQVTRSGWDPVAEAFSDDHEKHRHVLGSAFRRYLRLALELGILSRESNTIRPAFEDPEHVTRIAGAMFALKGRSKADGRLASRSARKYLKAIRQVIAAQGVATATLEQIIRNNKDSRAGAKAEKCMTKKNRQFCELLINQADKRRKFFGAFRLLRAEAERLLAEAAASGQPPAGHQLARVRMLGTAAAFAAIEIGGAPIRVGNAMGLTCMGEDAQIQHKGKKRTGPFVVYIPAEQTKQHGLTENALPVEFEIRHNKLGYHDTLVWYMQTIRPLFPHAESSAFLFPAVETAGVHLSAKFFADQFSNFMREIVNLPMTPHMMRHGQTSLLLHKHPTEVEVIAKRIGDHVATLRTYYGWIDGVKMVERGQDLLVGLMEE